MNTKFDDERKALDALLPEYKRAKELLRGENWTAEQLRVLARVRAIILGALSPTRPAEYTLGQVSEALEALEKVEAVVRDYDARRESLERWKQKIASGSDITVSPEM